MVQTEAGLAPADQAELRRAVALGTRPLTDEQLAQGLWCGNPAFDSPGEGAVLLGREDKAGGRGGMRVAEEPSQATVGRAAPGLGPPVTSSYSFICPGTQIRVLLGSWFIRDNSLVHRVFLSGWFMWLTES